MYENSAGYGSSSSGGAAAKPCTASGTAKSTCGQEAMEIRKTKSVTAPTRKSKPIKFTECLRLTLSSVLRKSEMRKREKEEEKQDAKFFLMICPLPHWLSWTGSVKLDGLASGSTKLAR